MKWFPCCNPAPLRTADPPYEFFMTMPTTTSPASELRDAQPRAAIPAPAPHQNAAEVAKLISSATAGLVPMFDPSRQLFCTKFIRTERGMVQEGLSPRYTLITLLGLHRLEQSGHPSPIALLPAFAALLRNSFGTAPHAAWLNNAGDLGLLLWLCALVAPERLDEFFTQHDLSAALDRFDDARERRTMELSWILSGLAHAAFARPEFRERLKPLAANLSATLQGNRGPAGAFGHQASAASKGLTGPLRGKLGSFADQVYPIYAFAWAHRAFGFAGALEIANACAANICKEQGELGQWWWHYDAKSGQAVGKYPVYSVHQHAMAPLALFALMDAGGRDTTRELYLGLEWIYGANELRVDMRGSGDPSASEAERNVVWRCIRPGKARRYMDEAVALLGLGKPQTPNALHVLHECWPYELGWLLYAFAGRAI
jgi:hypothetical protein